MPAHVAWFPVAAEKYAEELESVREEQLRDATSDTCPSVRGPVPSFHGKEREVTAGQAGSREVTWDSRWLRGGRGSESTPVIETHRKVTV